MNIMSTRTAPMGARFSRPTASHLATADSMLARAAAFGGGTGGRMTASATEVAPTPPASAVIQTAAGPVLNARAIYDRNNAIAAARAGR